MAAGGGRADEHHLANVALGDQRLADAMAVAGDDIDQPARHTGALDQHAQRQRGQRRQLRGLENHRIAGGDGRGDLPASGEDGRVPRRDLQHGAQRLVGDVVEVRGRDRNHLAVQLVGPARVVLEHFRDLGHLDPRIANRLVGAQRLQFGQGVGLLSDQAAYAVDGAPTGLGGQGSPLLLGLAAGGIGERDLRDVGIREGQHQAVILGVAHLDALTASFNELATD